MIQMNISYEMRLQECGVTKLETRRLREDQIVMFKILNGYENIDRKESMQAVHTGFYAIAEITVWCVAAEAIMTSIC